MRTLSTLISDLQAVKSSGHWGKISKASGVHYDTLARIARGKLKSPSVTICERISDALDLQHAATADQQKAA